MSGPSLYSRLLPAAAIAFFALGIPIVAEACSCGQALLTTRVSVDSPLFPPGDIVFAGAVVRVDRPQSSSSRVNADGTITVAISSFGRSVVTFEAEQVFRGRQERTFVLEANGTSCDFPFEPGQRWLVYANVHDNV
jgi:hypothetical protein